MGAAHLITGAAHLIMSAAWALFVAARPTACIPARSAGSIMAATRWHSPLAAGLAPAGVSTAAAASMAVGVFMAAEVTDENDAGTTVHATTKVSSITGVR